MQVGCLGYVSQPAPQLSNTPIASNPHNPALSPLCLAAITSGNVEGIGVCGVGGGEVNCHVVK